MASTTGSQPRAPRVRSSRAVRSPRARPSVRPAQPSQCGLLLDDVRPVVAVDRHRGRGALEQGGPLSRFSSVRRRHPLARSQRP